MRAWYYTAFGDASAVKLGDQPEAKIVDSHDIVVKVHAAALNPIDFKRRRGDLKLILTQHWPAIVGYDVSGVVVSCGPDATKFRVGDAVFATLPNTRIGSLAEFVSAHENVFAKKPSNLTHVQAASLAMTSLTSLLAFRRANLTPGKKVLITAGAGGVGASAIQIAKQVFQATDIATTASAKKADKVKELGATQVIDYNKDKFCDVLKDYDVALDCSKESVDCFKIIKPKGSVISIAEVPSPDLLYKRESEGIKISWFVGFALRMLSYSVRRKAQKADINYEFFFLASNGEALDEIRAWCEEGKLVPVLDKVYEFEKADEALAYLETGRATGKVVVEVVKEE